MQTFSLLKSLMGHPILNHIQAKQQPQKLSYKEKPYSTTQFLKRMLLTKKQIHFY